MPTPRNPMFRLGDQLPRGVAVPAEAWVPANPPRAIRMFPLPIPCVMCRLGFAYVVHQNEGCDARVPHYCSLREVLPTLRNVMFRLGDKMPHLPDRHGSEKRHAT